MAQSIDIKLLSAQLESIYDSAIGLEAHYAEDLAAVHPDFRDGALNLVHHLALRQPPGEPDNPGPLVPRPNSTRCHGFNPRSACDFGSPVGRTWW